MTVEIITELLITSLRFRKSFGVNAKWLHRGLPKLHVSTTGELPGTPSPTNYIQLNRKLRPRKQQDRTGVHPHMTTVAYCRAMHTCRGTVAPERHLPFGASTCWLRSGSSSSSSPWRSTYMHTQACVCRFNRFTAQVGQ